MKLTVVKQRITPQMRTLKANWTIETLEDFDVATTPWQYVKNWSMSDHDHRETLERLNQRMQNRWPGHYTIVKQPRWNGHNHYINEYVFEFKSPRDETWFRVQYG